MNKTIKDLGNKIGKTAVRHCGRSEAIQKNSVVLSVFSVVLCETKKTHFSYTELHRERTELHRENLYKIKKTFNFINRKS